MKACGACHRLRRQIQELQHCILKLQHQLAEAQRAAKRQAAPFAKTLKAHPRRPGRRSGTEYGRKGHRPVPTHVDEVVEVALPRHCPDCHGDIHQTDVVPQYQTELPRVRPVVTRFDVSIGQCQECGKRIQGRHPRQTSNALGAAASQLGPQALAFAAYCNKSLGLSFGKVQSLFQEHFQLSVTRSALCQSLYKITRVAEPTYRAMLACVRRAPVVVPDETGWRLAGRLVCLRRSTSHRIHHSPRPWL